MEFLFYLNDIEVAQPIGFAEIELSIIRDEKYHGVGFEASTGNLEFSGTGARILRDAKNADGINASVVFRATALCNAYQEEEVIVEGRINFGTYQEKCGEDCSVSVGVEEDSCIVVLRNREDQDIDVDSLVAFDKQTPLVPYAAMGIDQVLPAVSLDARIEASVGEDTVDEHEELLYDLEPAYIREYQIRPTYYDKKYNSLNTAQLDDPTNKVGFIWNDEGDDVLADQSLSPIFLMEENTTCYNGVFQPSVDIRIKGTLTVHSDQDDYFLQVIVYIVKIDASYQELPHRKLGNDPANYPGELIANTIYMESENAPTDLVLNFDEVYSNPSLTILPGESLWAYINVTARPAAERPDNMTINVVFDPETSVLVTQDQSCPSTNAQVYMLHETLSRAVESITNNCARVKSAYYGRTESEPFSFPQDGCGGLRFVTSGLKIRKAEKPFFFTSFKKIIDDLNGIDNIGFGLEDDETNPNKKIVIVEDVEHFYQDEVVLTLEAVPDAVSTLQESMHVSRFLIGYKKWEVERVNGLDEVNSTREYRTNFETLNNILDVRSDFVTGSYAWEITRQQSFASTGAADTKFDNDTFLACVNRAGYNTFTVERGEVADGDNIYSPNTKYNIRITPARNALRWFKSIANGYTNIYNTSNKIFFSSGTGNISACIKLIDTGYSDPCVDEAVKLCENQDLSISLFSDVDKGAPIWKNETIDFDYPLSIGEYKLLKQNRYKKIKFQCGLGEYDEGWIKEIKFRPIEGEATFTLIKKY
jgi:hypothetical protein